MLHEILVLLLAPAAVVAETPSTGSINGVVRDAGTSAPLAGVHVSLGGDEAATDSQGRFRFEAVEPGSKRLWASDKTRVAGAGVSVIVRAGEEATAEIRLKLGGNINGRVLDSAGQPVPNAVVMLLGRRYRYGEVVYSPSQSVAADELPPYEKRETVLLPEHYPQTVTLTSGETRDHVDIRMPASPAYCIEGSVDAPATEKQIFVSFTERLSSDSGWSLTPASIKASADGQFCACGLPGETYRVAATAPPGSSLRDSVAGDTTALATGDVIITGQDMRDLKLFEARPVAIAGDASFDPPPREKPRNNQIGLMRSINGGEGYADSTEKPASFGMYGVGLPAAEPRCRATSAYLLPVCHSFRSSYAR